MSLYICQNPESVHHQEGVIIQMMTLVNNNVSRPVYQL